MSLIVIAALAMGRTVSMVRRTSGRRGVHSTENTEMHGEGKLSEDAIGLALAKADQTAVAREASHANISQTRDAGEFRTTSNSSLPLMYQDGANCLKWTGGTCWTTGCDGDRGATCYRAACYCKPGNCVAGDGRCYAGDNRMVRNNFTLRNAYWPDQMVYFPEGIISAFSDRLRTSTSGGSKFDLLAMGDNRSFLLAASDWPGHAVAIHSILSIGHDHEIDDLGDVGHHAVAERYDARLQPIDGWDATVQTASLTVCDPRHADYPGAVMLRSVERYGMHAASLFIKHLSYKVYAYEGSGDPGAGGYWFIDPPLGTELPYCF